MTEEGPPGAPALLYIVGPPAVGKMTVGGQIAERTGFRLFHNHLTIEPVLRFFEFGSPPFNRLVGEFRGRLIEEVAASGLPGLIFTYVWAFDLPGEQAALEEYAKPFLRRGGRVLYVESTSGSSPRAHRQPAWTVPAARPFILPQIDRAARARGALPISHS